MKELLKLFIVIKRTIYRIPDTMCQVCLERFKMVLYIKGNPKYQIDRETTDRFNNDIVKHKNSFDKKRFNKR